VTRIAEVKAALAVNVEAERKLASLSDEMQALARTLRTKEQTIQESTVKIQLMERRLETVKKQADAIVELENELAKARKQERTYEEAMEQLHSDLDALEQDNSKLKALTAGQERQGPGPQQTEPENIPVEGSLETSQLFEQVCSANVFFFMHLTNLPRSRPCGVQYVSYRQKTPTSKATASCAKLRPSLPFLKEDRVLKLLCSWPLETRTLICQIRMNLLHHLLYSHYRWRPRNYTGML